MFKYRKQYNDLLNKTNKLLERIEKLEEDNANLRNHMIDICDLGEHTAELIENSCDRFNVLEKLVNDLIIHKYMIMNSDNEYFFRVNNGQLLLTLFDNDLDTTIIKDIVIIPDIKEGYCIKYKWFNDILFLRLLVIEEIENQETIEESYLSIIFANNIPEAECREIDNDFYNYMIPYYINEESILPKQLLDANYNEAPFIKTETGESSNI